MATVNADNISTTGTATMTNGEFLTFDSLVINNFSLIIPSMPDVTFFLQKVNLPDISIGEVKVATRYVDYNQIGEKLKFVPFTASFMVDKYLRNYSNIFNRMKAMTVAGSTIGATDDIILMMGNHEFIRFYGAWPTNLSGWTFDSTITGVVYAKCDVTFNYDYADLAVANYMTVDSTY